jgi:hypothetical protein
MSRKKIVKFFTGIELVLILTVLGGGWLGVENYKDKKELKKTAQQNVEQAVHIEELTHKVEEVNQQKDLVVVELQKVEEEIKDKAATGFSILYEQAEDIDEEHSSTYTKVHKQTAKDLVKVWGYDAMAKLIKWQQDQIKAQISETKKLMEEKEKLKVEYLEYKVKTEQVIGQTKTEAEEHRRTAESLKGEISNFMDKNGWLQGIIKWLIIGTGVYVFITFGGIPLFFRLKNKAISQVQEQLIKEKTKKKDAMKSIKAFKAANDDGNDTMDRILASMQVDADKDDD